MNVLSELYQILDAEFDKKITNKNSIFYTKKFFFLNLFIFISLFIVLYLLFGALVIKNEPVNEFLLKINAAFISFIFSLSTHFLSELGVNTWSDSLTIYINNSESFSGISGYKAYRWVLLVFIIIWLSPVAFKRKAIFSLLVLIITFFAYLTKTVSWVALSDSLIDKRGDAIKLAHVIIHLTYYLLICIWIKINLKNIKGIYDKLHLNVFLLIEKNYKVLFFLFLFIILFNNVGMSILSFKHYIYFIFFVTQKILTVLNYESIINGAYLTGENGGIYLAKFCLGINTMIVFSSIVWITGKNISKKTIFVFIGIILINIVNILRFVFLFIYLQKHGSYELAMDFHDIFDYAIYIFIFCLWIIWLEKFTDIWNYLEKEEVKI